MVAKTLIIIPKKREKEMKDIELLIFDLDNTLINYGRVTKKAWEMTCQKYVEKYDIGLDAIKMTNEIVKVNNSIWEDENKRPKGNFSFYELRKLIVSEALGHFEIDNNTIIEFLVGNYSQCKHDAVYVFEDVLETLKELKREVIYWLYLPMEIVLFKEKS